MPKGKSGKTNEPDSYGKGFNEPKKATKAKAPIAKAGKAAPVKAMKKAKKRG